MWSCMFCRSMIMVDALFVCAMHTCMVAEFLGLQEWVSSMIWAYACGSVYAVGLH